MTGPYRGQRYPNFLFQKTAQILLEDPIASSQESCTPVRRRLPCCVFPQTMSAAPRLVTKAAVLFHLRVQFDNPEERFIWNKKMILKLVEIERRVFLFNFEQVEIVLKLNFVEFCMFWE